MQMVEWCRLPCRGRLLGRSAGGGGIAQIVIAGNTEDPEAMSVCEVVREMVQVRMQVVVEVVHSILESAMNLQSADYLLVVLTKGLLRCEAFAQVLLAFREAPNREDEPVDIVTVLADTAFDFPGPELYDRLAREGQRRAGPAGGRAPGGGVQGLAKHLGARLVSTRLRFDH